jgi:hypothetical protein
MDICCGLAAFDVQECVENFECETERVDVTLETAAHIMTQSVSEKYVLIILPCP